MNVRGSVSLFITVLLSACAPQLSAREQAVYVLPDTELPRTCRFLGEVRGTEDLVTSVTLGAEARTTRLRQMTAALGGDTATLFGADASVLGSAYRCMNYTHLRAAPQPA